MYGFTKLEKQTIDNFNSSNTIKLTRLRNTWFNFQLGQTPISPNGLYQKMILQNWCCAYCDEKITFDVCEFDHIYPVSKGGLHTLRNTAIVCKKCNGSKSSHRLSVWCKKTKKEYLSIMQNIDDINVKLEEIGFEMGEITIMAF